MSDPLRLGVLISGGGSTLDNLIRCIDDGRLRGVTVACVISTRSDVRGVEIARAAGIQPVILTRRDYPDDTAFSEAVSGALTRARVDLVAMGGFLRLWHIPPTFAGRVLNIHPALLPKFGGKGMYGQRVHQAVLAGGAKESGCTVHVADNEYDHGPIVAWQRVPVLEGDTPETLAARVGAAERELYPRVIQRYADEHVRATE